ncbi:MAG: hypothetical protein LQ341_000985 [Variospora aurantia]|nr:MAG: hypothetical protein LQ341_000985 [Variospora aurantia]
MSLDIMPDHALHQRFQDLKGVEHHKNELIIELLRRIDSLSNDYQQMSLDHQRETQFNREGQLKEQQLKNEIRKLQSFMSRDPFVSVLIDGDGMIFEDELMRRGELGGKEAATKLWNAIKDHMHEKLPSIPSDCRIVTRIYANLKGLAEICYKSGIVERINTIEDFYRGFTGSKILFDFVDVGHGKDRADEKITELFKLHLNDYHCHHIYFGCSHDNGYARLLEQYTEPTHTTRITLVEGVPFERELKFLQSQFSCVKFDDLFRPNKISIYNPSQHPTSQPAPSQSARTSSDTYGVPLSQAQNIYQSPYQPMIGDTSPSTAPNNAPMMNPKASSWASTATAAAQLVSPPATPTPAVSQSISSKDIPRNRYGQRVDPPVVYDKEVVNRVRNLKLCNVHFLRKDCQYDPCTHDHCYKITKNELTSLRSIARNVPCYFGNECDDPKCIYGHK